MPTAIQRPPYEATRQFIHPLVPTANAAKAEGPSANVQGGVDVNATLSVTNASDHEFAYAKHYVACWQHFDIPEEPSNTVTVKAFYKPLKTVHTRAIVDEFGYSSLSLAWMVYAICNIATPPLGWQKNMLIDSVSDVNFRSHVVPNTVGAPRSAAFTGKWPLPPGTKFPSGLTVLIGLYMRHWAVSNDVTLTSFVQSKGKLDFISVDY